MLCRQYTTSPLLKHLRRKHPEEYELCTKESTDSRQNAATSGTTNEGQLKTCVNQVTMNRFVSPTPNKQWASDHPRAITIHAAIGKMIAIDLEPYSIVEDTGFTELLQLLEPRYKIPSRRFFADKIIPEMQV